MRRFFSVIVVVSFFSTACIDDEFLDIQDFNFQNEGVWVVNEGNFLYGNASLTYIDLVTEDVFQAVFLRANGTPLGDVAQSIAFWNEKVFVVVNNSQKIYAIHAKTAKFLGKITGLVSPRYMHIFSDEKAYVTDLYAKNIAIVNPTTYQVKSWIDVGHTTESMQSWGDSLFVISWVNSQTVLVIDTNIDKVIDSIKVGFQPQSLALDKNQKIWVLCQGGNQNGRYKNPTLHCIDAQTVSVEITFTFASSSSPSNLIINSTKDTLFFINKHIFKMPITERKLPEKPFIDGEKHLFYGINVHPSRKEIFVCDAVDYLQSGYVYRYSLEGKLINVYEAGVIPSKCYFR